MKYTFSYKVHTNNYNCKINKVTVHLFVLKRMCKTIIQILTPLSEKIAINKVDIKVYHFGFSTEIYLYRCTLIIDNLKGKR